MNYRAHIRRSHRQIVQFARGSPARSHGRTHRHVQLRLLRRLAIGWLRPLRGSEIFRRIFNFFSDWDRNELNILEIFSFSHNYIKDESYNKFPKFLNLDINSKKFIVDEFYNRFPKFLNPDINSKKVIEDEFYNRFSKFLNPDINSKKFFIYRISLLREASLAPGSIKSPY